MRREGAVVPRDSRPARVAGFLARLLLPEPLSVMAYLKPLELRLQCAGAELHIPAPTIESLTPVLKPGLRAMAERLSPRAVVALIPAAGGRSTAVDAMLQPAALSFCLRSGFVQLLADRRIKIKPDLTIVGAEELAPLLHGYQYAIMREAAFEAGARRVAFDNSDGGLPPEIAEFQMHPVMPNR